MKKPISATIITLNEENTIQTCIQNISQLCDEVIVLDSYSKDKTTDIASFLGAFAKNPNEFCRGGCASPYNLIF